MAMPSEVNSELHPNQPSEEISSKDGDASAPSIPSMAAPLQNPAKRPTRQWAAWTRQEEENFFNALRQVGKNFEKITCRVQSKNKDQVRHYYYRLVRRMNKLLGPGFSLDAKNSKDTNAAMLRWWSLLEKYSCTASKLHLKPRRFKTFIETLAHQLLKDRNKTRKKRPSPGEDCSSLPSVTEPILGKPPGNDSCSVKLVFIDSRCTQKGGPPRGASLKRGVNSNINGNKGELSTMKTVRQKRRTASGAASTAYKRWERAAIAGVSLVADAAEQLERATKDRTGSLNQGTLDVISKKNSKSRGQKQISFSGVVVHPLPPPISRGVCSQHQIVETSIQPFMKLKLQLFPIDDHTRKAIEKDEHNPHLELTLSARKRISSILDHLNRKWGTSSIASGELMLFPYSIQLNDIGSCKKWSLKDSDASAADVYASVGSPAIFRLRYGWFSDAVLGSGIVQIPTHCFDSMQSKDIQERNVDFDVSPERVNMNVVVGPSSPTSHIPDQLTASLEDESNLMMTKSSMISQTDVAEAMIGNNSMELQLPASFQHAPTSSWLREEIEDGGEQKEDMETLRTSNADALSAGEWADSLTNISIGDLLAETSRAADSYQIDPSTGRSAVSLQNIPFSCDSFDAAIAALSGHQHLPNLSNRSSHASSIWDAEETCDEFSFRRFSSAAQDHLNTSSSISIGAHVTHTQSHGFEGFNKVVADVEPLNDPPSEGDLEANTQSDEELISHVKDHDEENLGLADISWPDSLGPLDLDLSSARYQDQDLIFGESISLSGLSRLIASSVDAFQNCSFFGTDKQEPSVGEVRDPSFLLDNKVGTEG